ncbi:hypothetical protein HDV01_007711 [Terramyces sp. JEL0728]|nr:hypothetical protein HDV01_007711 [Terramyces sp. JEL0728]
MAILSGFAAVNSPYSNLAVFLRPVSEGDLKRQEQLLISALESLITSKKNNTSDIQAKEMFLNQMFVDYDNLLVDREKSLLATSWRGIYTNLLGYFFSFYCIYKVFTSMINLIFNRSNGKDIVTRILNIMVHWVGLDLDLEFWSAQLSFILIGVMVIVAVRGFILQFSKVSLMATTTNSDTPIAFLTHLMGFYLSSVALGIEARNVRDEDLDKYAAELILKQSQKIKTRFELIEEPSTEQYNEALKNGIVQAQSNEQVLVQEPKKKKKKTRREPAKEPREIDYTSDQGKDTEKKHLNALVKHSKLKIKKTKKVYTGKKGLVEALLGQVDQGVYGPIAGVTTVPVKDNKINPTLPESCPW